MKKKLTGMSRETVFKKTGWKLLLVLATLIWSAIMPAVSFAEWTIEAVDTEGDVGQSPSIAIDSNNNVHTSYYDSTNGALKYATNASGIWVAATVDAEGQVGWSNSIAIDSNNNVHISYYDSTNGALKYATNTSDVWGLETVDAEGRVGWSNSIAIDSNDNVHISYGDSNNALKYATNASGIWVAETVDAQVYVGQYTFIAIDSNDNLHISYCGWGLKYATNASGSWVVENITGLSGGPIQNSSIAIDSNDNVHISYYQSIFDSEFFSIVGGYLRYVSNASGSWVFTTIGLNEMGGGSSIAIDSNDNLHISYHVDNSWGLPPTPPLRYDLRYATNASGSWLIKDIYSVGEGVYPSIAIDSNDNLHISYTGVTRLNADNYNPDNFKYDLEYATNAPAVQNVSAEEAYDVLITDPTAVMFDTRTVDEHNGYCLPWDQNCASHLESNTAYAGTPQWALGGVEKLPITMPYWYAGIARDIGPPEDEAQVRNIIEGALAANIIDFDTPIYFLGRRSAFRSYYMVLWMNTQTFTNPATNETALFTNLFNIDSDTDPSNLQGGMQAWNAASLPIFDGTIVPPQVFSGYPEDGYIKTSPNDVIFAAGVLEPTTGGFVYPDVTEVLLYVDGSAPVSMTQVDEVVLRSFLSIPDDVVLPGKVYMATKYLPDGIYTWNVRATNSAGASWNLHVLNGSAQGPGQRTLTVDACSPSGDDTDCNGRDDDCDGIPDNNYLPTDTTCGVGVCGATGLLTCNNAMEVDSCLENEPTGDDFDCDGLDNNCDGVADNNFLPTATTCGLGVCAATGQTECIDGAAVDTCAPGTPAENQEATCDDILDNDCDGLTDTDDSDCPLTYTITTTTGSDGSISPSGDVMVDAGSDQTFTITPGRGYQVSDVLIDAVSVGQVRSYTFTNVSSDHRISAEFIRRGMRRGRGSRIRVIH